MKDDALAIVSALIGLAILSVVLSKNAQTVGVLNAAASALSSVLKVVVSPITSTSGN